MLGRVIGMHWHALVHDVLALGYRASDILTTLTLSEMVSIVVGAGPTSSVRFFMDEGWSRESHLLANMQESHAGMANLQQPYQRPGTWEQPIEQRGTFQAEVMTWDQFDERNKKRYTDADEITRRGITPTNTQVRTI